jgi:DNA-binding MarR family transcriptional regulator
VNGVESHSQGCWSDPLSAAVFQEFMGIAHRQRLLLHRVFAKQDLHPGQAACMRMLFLRGEMRQSELADAMILSRPSVTRMLQRMERAGLVVRRTPVSDQRQTLVTLTPTGRDLQHRMDAAIAEYVTATLARLPEGDRRELARILPAWRELAEDALTMIAMPAAVPATLPLTGEPAAEPPLRPPVGGNPVADCRPRTLEWADSPENRNPG